jgi:hypothetical protein
MDQEPNNAFHSTAPSEESYSKKRVSAPSEAPPTWAKLFAALDATEIPENFLSESERKTGRS